MKNEYRYSHTDKSDSFPAMVIDIDNRGVLTLFPVIPVVGESMQEIVIGQCVKRATPGKKSIERLLARVSG